MRVRIPSPDIERCKLTGEKDEPMEGDIGLIEGCFGLTLAFLFSGGCLPLAIIIAAIIVVAS